MSKQKACKQKVRRGVGRGGGELMQLPLLSLLAFYCCFCKQKNQNSKLAEESLLTGITLSPF